VSDKFAALKACESPWMDFAHNDSPKCPHCGESFDIDDNEAWRLYDDNDDHEVTCPSCGGDFTVRSHSRWTFSTDTQDDDA
jgi:uncharacterized Zn-finger protein